MSATGTAENQLENYERESGRKRTRDGDARNSLENKGSPIKKKRKVIVVLPMSTIAELERQEAKSKSGNEGDAVIKPISFLRNGGGEGTLAPYDRDDVTYRGRKRSGPQAKKFMIHFQKPIDCKSEGNAYIFRGYREGEKRPSDIHVSKVGSCTYTNVKDYDLEDVISVVDSCFPKVPFSIYEFRAYSSDIKPSRR
jgi:hypothetical protein